MFYPFMPGTYDAFAVSVSGMAQVFGMAGIVLVPIGMAWLVHDTRSKAKKAAPTALHRWFAYAALFVSLLVGTFMALATLQSGPALVFVIILGCVYAAWRAVRAVRRGALNNNGIARTAAVFLIVVPAMLAIARFAFIESAVELSRRRTIAGSAEFISKIEAYRSTHGRYPPSLESVHHDYDPPTVGVERYRYEPWGESYNVFFEQPTYPIGMREFVMYNPRDEHQMMVHNYDLLESPAAQVEAERNYHARAARDAGVRHWKYFWFD